MRTCHRTLLPATLLLFIALAVVPASAFYNPTTGRWLSRDPIGEKGGNNSYRFVRNHSVHWVDPVGLYTENFTQINGTANSGGKIGSPTTVLGLLESDFFVRNVRVSVVGCECRLESVVIHQEQTMYLPIVGDWEMDSPRTQDRVDQEWLDNVTAHENQHKKDCSAIGSALGSALEGGCIGKYLYRRPETPWTHAACFSAWWNLLQQEKTRLDAPVNDAGNHWDAYPKSPRTFIATAQFVEQDAYVQSVISTFLDNNEFCPFAHR